MKKKLSIHDIARQLNISATTVSFVINGKKGISEALQLKVLQHIKKVGYQPNLLAQSLRTGKTFLIGMLVEDISDYFFSGIARKVEELAYEQGYKIFFASTENDAQKTISLIRKFSDGQVDGFIIAPPPGIEDEIQSLLNDSKPLILFDRYFPNLDTTNVIVDNAGGAYMGVRHLIENGFTNIALITLNSEQVQMKDRLRGYNKAINENKLPKFVQKIEYKTDPDKVTEIIVAFLKKKSSIDAILFATNYLAVSGLKAIRELGLRIPRDIGVVGFDDNINFELFAPPITVISQPVGEISKQTIEQLMRAIDMKRKTKKKKTIVLPTELIVRESSLSSVSLIKIRI